jgi:CPA2 family monovalent cation:H+ antiporter-2
MAAMNPVTPEPTPGQLPRRRVVIAGYGPVGRCVAEQLRAIGVDVTIIELNPDTVEKQLRLNHSVVHGDVTRAETLTRARIQEADALIVAVPDCEVAVRACAAARRLAPNLFIAARTNFLSKGLQATEAGADEVIVEEVVTAAAMRDAVMRRLLGTV